MGRFPRIDGPAGLPLVCLGPHGVFPASRIAPRAVSSYLAFSTLPALRCQRTGGVFSVTLSVNLDLRLGCPRVLRGMLPYGVRTFLCRAVKHVSDHLPSRAIYHILLESRGESGSQKATNRQRNTADWEEVDIRDSRIDRKSVV